MTWNLWWRFGPQWRDRQPVIVQALREADPDITVLQEVWGRDGTSQAHEFAEQLGMHAAFATPALPPLPDPPENDDQKGVDMGVAVLSRWPFLLVEPLEMPAPSRKVPNVWLRTTVDHPAGELHVIAACLEWESEYQRDRLLQAETLTGMAMDPTLDGALPVVVAGDLNAAPDSPVLRPLRDAMTDAWVAAHGDPDAVTLSSAHPYASVTVPELIDQRIDHIFVRPGRREQELTGQSALLAGYPVQGLDPSDHMAVVCDIGWTQPGVR